MVRAYHCVLKTKFVELGATDVCEIQCLNFEESFRVAAMFASGKWDLVETLVCW